MRFWPGPLCGAFFMSAFLVALPAQAETLPNPAFGKRMALRVAERPLRFWRPSDDIAFHHFCADLDDAREYIGLLTTQGPDAAARFWSSGDSSCWQSVMSAHGQLVAPASPVFTHGTQSFRIWEVKVLDLFFRAAGFPQKVFVLLLDRAPGEPA